MRGQAIFGWDDGKTPAGDKPKGDKVNGTRS
jgi:hypothetical protein